MPGIRCFVLVLLFTLTHEKTYSQGELLFKGESGFGASLGLAKSNDALTFAVSLGYAPFDFLDFALSIGRLEQTGSSGMTGSSFSPNFTLYLMKQEKKGRHPTLGVNVGYTYVSLTSGNSNSANGGALSIGLCMTRQVVESDNILVQPLFYGGYISGDASGIAGSFSLALGYRFENGSLVAFSPSIMYAAIKTAFGGSISVVL